jgi:transcriptional regulator with PAS, ATPase and Fis domain
MKAFIGLQLMFIGHTYLVQKDLITYAIKNHMIRRQQTQLKQFFGSVEDPTFILDKSGELIWSNAAASRLYRGSGQLDVQLTSQIYTVSKQDRAGSFDSQEPDSNFFATLLNLTQRYSLVEILSDLKLSNNWIGCEI